MVDHQEKFNLEQKTLVAHSLSELAKTYKKAHDYFLSDLKDLQRIFKENFFQARLIFSDIPTEEIKLINNFFTDLEIASLRFSEHSRLIGRKEQALLTKQNLKR